MPALESTESIDLSTLETHDKLGESVWTAFEGKVYDITKFIDSGLHPGGDIIRLSAGRDR